MRIKATLSNTRHPEYGEVTIPLPIKTSEYDRTMEMLANLEIGDVMGRDCKIMELSSPYSILQKLEGSEVNIDELDYHRGGEVFRCRVWSSRTCIIRRKTPSL